MVKKKRQHDVQDDGTWTDSCDENPQSPGAISNSCQHVKKAVDTGRLRKLLKTTGLLLECNHCVKLTGVSSCGSGVDASDGTDENSSYEYDDTLWLCLKCGTQLCGRSKNQHALLHFKTPHSDSHALTINTRSFEIWCYDCDNEVSPNTRKNLLECVELVKKLAQKPPSIPTTAAATGLDSASLEVTSAAAATVADTVINNIENKIIATWEALSPLVSTNTNNSDTKTSGDADYENCGGAGIATAGAIPLPPPPYLQFPGCAKRVDITITSATSSIIKTAEIGRLGDGKGAGTLHRLPRVRGLTNLGNTCFFNAVLQCLAQTPFLLDVLKELGQPGEEFQLPGGTFKLNGEEDIELPSIKGSLSSWGGLTAALANALEELQSSGGVFTPSKLFDKLCSKCPQFTGGYQHDSHELLRQLLESVRSEDLKRYQRVILQNLGYKDQDINTVSEEMRLKCKIYGNQAADRILRPEQVFRGFLVSTLTCQECFTVSSRHEYFLDMSLPVATEKPQPPQRRKASPDLECSMASNGNNSKFGGDEDDDDEAQPQVKHTFSPFYLHPTNGSSLCSGPTKSQVKRDKEKERKAKRAAKHQKTKQTQWLSFKATGLTKAKPLNTIETTEVIGDGNGTNGANVCGASDKRRVPIIAGGGTTSEEIRSSSVSLSEHSDADVEDNLVDDNLPDVKHITASSHPPTATPTATPATTPTTPFYLDTNGNNEHLAEMVEHMDKDSLEEDENVSIKDSGIATSPLHAACTGDAASSSSTVASASAPASNSTNNNSNTAVNADDGTSSCEVERTNSVISFGLSEKGASIVRQLSLGDKEGIGHTKPTTNFLNGSSASSELSQKLDEMMLKDRKYKHQKHQQPMRQKRTRTQSYSDWCTTIAPRYQCDDGECSIQSCLNNFTAVELMTGNNKVGCESCTKRINGEDPKAATVNTNATKQFLVSSPPAVLILHLKRFQLGQRCIFRKLTRAVNFPFLLDVAPFCGSKVKNLPNIDRRQKKLIYALYGVVEHAGGMYGGHYTAYVKVRPKLVPDDKRWTFLPHGSKAELDQDDEQLKKLEELLAKEKAREMRLKTVDDSDDLTSSNSSMSNDSQTQTNEDDDGKNFEDAEDLRNMEDATGNAFDPDISSSSFMNGTETGTPDNKDFEDEAANVEIPFGKWYYVSDSRVQEVNEETVLRSQAYLLFYERIY